MGILSYMKTKIHATLALLAGTTEATRYQQKPHNSKPLRYRPKNNAGRSGDKLARKAKEGSIGCPNGRVY